MPRISTHMTEHKVTGDRTLFIFVDDADHHIVQSSITPNFDAVSAEVDRLVAKQAAYDHTPGSDLRDLELPTQEEIDNLVDMIAPARAIVRRFQRTSFDRLTVRDGKIFLDNEEVTNALTEQILRFIEEGQDFEPLVRFYEKLLSNTDDRNPEAAEHSRQQLYRWLASGRFSITPEGDILGYKYVGAWDSHRPDGDHPWAGIEADYCSTMSGPAIVDGIEGSGYVPQPFGSMIEMERSAVTFDPSVSCAPGLHVGNWEYMGTTSRNVIEVIVNPRDVVSIPTDSNDRKMRVSRYRVLGQAHGERTDALVLPVPAPEPTTEPEVESPTTPVPTMDTPRIDSYSVNDDEERCYDCEEYVDDCRCDEEEWEAEWENNLPEPTPEPPVSPLKDWLRGKISGRNRY